jgi:glyceraldehyde-3-phosphate dehydrogenase (NADP+)
VTEFEPAVAALPWVDGLDRGLPLPLVINGLPLITDDIRQFLARDDSGMIRRVAFGDARHAADAVAGAFASRLACAELSRADRAAILRRVANAVEQEAEGLAASLVREVGKSLRDSRGEVARTVSTLRVAADAVTGLVGAEVPVDSVDVGRDRIAYTSWEPAGVVSAICGFNFPLLLAVHKLSAAIGAGCPIVIKPSERTPFTTLVLARMVIDAGWPQAGISIVNGGTDVGVQFTEHEHVAVVSFTGSSPVGARIAATAGAHLKRVVLELGSNAATIVAQDADLELAASRCAAGGMASTGQSCISVQRVIVHRDVAAAFSELLAARVRALRGGDPSSELTDVGRLVSDDETARVRALIVDAVGYGAELLAGPGDGQHLAPTLLGGVSEAARLAQEEAFGPVIAIFSYEDDVDAVRLANSTPFGLMAGVFTASLERAMFFARRIESGGVHINDTSNFRPDNMPYGGVKASGLGKEGPAWAMREFSNEKVVTLRLPRSPQ